jgi:hypothetical protein
MKQGLLHGIWLTIFGKFYTKLILNYTNIIIHADILKGEIASTKSSLKSWLCYGCAKVSCDLLLVTCDNKYKHIES